LLTDYSSPPTGLRDSFVANEKGRKTGERGREERKWKEEENSLK